MTYWAHLSTTNYEFDAFGRTEDEARHALALAWNKHRQQTGAALTWHELREDVGITEVHEGEAFRDREPFRRMDLVERVYLRSTGGRE